MRHIFSRRLICTHHRTIFFFIVLFLLLGNIGVSHSIDSTQTDGEKGIITKKNFSLLAVSSLFTVTMIDSYLAWWKGNYHSFGFYDPSVKGGWFGEPGILGIDKIGHFYGAYFLYKTKKNILEWGGFSEETAKWISLGFTGGVGLLIEIGDGFSSYAFDYRDLLLDAAGIGFAMLQDKIPFFQNFNFKWSYFPPDKFTLRFTQHYDGNIFWLTADVFKIFFSEDEKSLLRFIQPAIGFSVGDKGSHREFIAGLDFNLTSLFNSNDENWNLLGRTINLFHIPAPGVKYAPSRKPEYKVLLFD